MGFNLIKKIKSKNLNERKYDLFFSGILKNWNYPELQKDIRLEIQKEIFFCISDMPILKKFKYRKLKIYWKPFYRNRFKNKFSNFIHGKRLSQNDYQTLLEDSKVIIHTSSPLGIISTRIFEALGSGALGFFSADSNASILFKKNTHYLEFKDLQDFKKTFKNIYKKSNLDRLQQIANRSRDLVKKEHSWNKRIEYLIKVLSLEKKDDVK